MPFRAWPSAWGSRKGSGTSLATTYSWPPASRPLASPWPPRWSFPGLLALLSVWIVYRVVQEIDTPISGILSALAFSVAPYLLLYARSAYSESNYVSLSLAGMALHLMTRREIVPGRGMSTRKRRLCALGAGLMWGAAITVNSAAMPLIGVYGAASLISDGPRSAKAWWPLGVTWGLVVLGMGAVLVGVLAPIWRSGLLNEERFVDSVKYHALSAGRSRLTLMGPAYLVKFGLGLLLPLAIPGSLRLWRTFGRRGILMPLFGLGILLFYLRIPVTYPRIFLPLCVPFLILSGPGLAEIMTWFNRARIRPVRALGPSLVAVCLASEVMGAVAVWPPQSGYEKACEWLSDDHASAIITTHSWWTFLTFAGCRAASGMDSTVLAGILDQEDYSDRLKEYLSEAHQRGCSHMVLDYLLWNALKPGASARLQAFMQQMPPDQVIPNPVARHEQTFMEDGALPDLRKEPLSWNIYIYRLNRFDPTAPGHGAARPSP